MDSWRHVALLLLGVCGFVLLIAGLAFVFAYLYGKKRRFVRSVKVRPFGLSLVTRQGLAIDVGWEDLVVIAVDITGTGPFGEDVLWEVTDIRGHIYCIPQSLASSQQLLERFQKLPRFDNDAVVQAMCTARSARFVCWRASGGPLSRPRRV